MSFVDNVVNVASPRFVLKVNVVSSVSQNQIFDGRTIYVEIAKPGSGSFGGYPRTSGPPKERPNVEQEDIADCWY